MEYTGNIEGCQFSEGCKAQAETYLDALDIANLWSNLTTPNSPATLADGQPPAIDPQLQEKAAANIAYFEQAVKPSLLKRMIAINNGCEGCPVRSLTLDILRESPPIDPETGEIIEVPDDI